MDPFSHLVAGRAVVALVDKAAAVRLGAAARSSARWRPTSTSSWRPPAGTFTCARTRPARTRSSAAFWSPAPPRARARGRRAASRVLPLARPRRRPARDEPSRARSRVSARASALAGRLRDGGIGLPLVAMADPWLVGDLRLPPCSRCGRGGDAFGSCVETHADGHCGRCSCLKAVQLGRAPIERTHPRRRGPRAPRCSGDR